MRSVNRFTPAAGAQHFKTYQLAQPLATHWRAATCAEVDCPHHLHGWKTILPVNDDRIPLIKQSGRRYVERRTEAGLVEFTFEAGQACFQAGEHRAQVGRPELYVVRDGDWRGNPRGTPARTHTRPELWVEDFSEHQDRIATAIERG